MPLFPLFADLQQRPVLVVGGGMVAERKVEALLKAGAQVTVGAPELAAGLVGLRDAGRITHHAGPYREAWLDGAWLVVAATSDVVVNRLVAAAAAARRIFVNVVDDAQLSSFHVPAVIDRAPLTIAISSGGAAPMFARLLRERLEATLPPGCAETAGTGSA